MKTHTTSLQFNPVSGKTKSRLIPILVISFFCIFFRNTQVYAANDDAGVDSIFGLPTSFCSGVYSVDVDVRNFGSNTLTSFSLGWSINGKILTPVKSTGSLSVGNSTNYGLGNFNFPSGTYIIKAWTYSPNGNTDPVPSNDTAFLTVTSNAHPTSSLGAFHNICIGSTYTLGASAVSGYKYSWSTIPAGFSSTSSNPVVNPSATTTYFLHITNAAGCTTFDSTTVVVFLLPVVSAGGNQGVCAGSSITLGGSTTKGLSYSWTSYPAGFTSTNSNPVITPTLTAEYRLTATFTGSGCSNTDSAHILVNSLPVANVGSDQTICMGNSVSVGATSVSGHTYKWSSGPVGFSSTISNPVVTPTTTTKYYLQETITATGCSASGDVAVIVYASPIANSGGNHSICTGSSIAIGGSATSGHLYSWTSNPAGSTSTDNNPTVSPTATTTYTVTETITATGCSNSSSAVITVNPLPTPNAGANNSICIGSSIAIGASSVGGHQYSWSSNPTGFSSTQSHPTVSPTATTTFTITETIVATGCSNSVSVTITVNALPTPNAGGNHTICNGASITLGSNTTSNNLYSWSSSPAGYTSTLSNPSVNPSVSTTYTLSETTPTGCTSINVALITVNTKPIADFGYTTGCLGDSTIILNRSISSGSYSWKFGDGSTSTATNPQHLYASLGTYTISLKAQNSSGCIDSIAKTVKITTCVWPGDANFDKKADIYDLLAIGVAYSDTGSKRIDTTTDWSAHACNDWSGNFASGANHKHADCNGDGIVDSFDMGAISRNYGKTHSKTEGTSSGDPANPDLYLTVTKDSVNVSDTLSINVSLGTSVKTVSNVYGVCFGVTYDPTNTNVLKGIKVDLSKCWLGTLGKNLIYLVHNDSTNGILDIGITRTDHKNVSGYGEIGVITIIMPDNVGGKNEVKKELKYNIINVKAIKFNEADVPLHTIPDSTLLYQHKTGINLTLNLGSNIHIYPNPANSILHLDAGERVMNEVNVYNILGEKVILQKTTLQNQCNLDISNLVSGMYIINVKTDKGMVKTRFIKQ